LTDIPVIACLKVKERGCDANVQRKPKGGKQEHKAEGDKVIFHGHLPEFCLASRLPRPASRIEKTKANFSRRTDPEKPAYRAYPMPPPN
jgi:hypothetical protein